MKVKNAIFPIIFLLFTGCAQNVYKKGNYLKGEEYELNSKNAFRLWIIGDFDSDSITLFVNHKKIVEDFIIRDDGFIEVTFDNGVLSIEDGKGFKQKNTDFSNNFFSDSESIYFDVQINKDHFHRYIKKYSDGRNFQYSKLTTSEGSYLESASGEIIFSQHKFMPLSH